MFVINKASSWVGGVHENSPTLTRNPRGDITIFNSNNKAPLLSPPLLLMARLVTRMRMMNDLKFLFHLLRFCYWYACTSGDLPRRYHCLLWVLDYIRQVPSQPEKQQHLQQPFDCKTTAALQKEERGASWKKQLTQAMISTLQVKIYLNIFFILLD